LVLTGLFFIVYPLAEEGRAFLADLRPTSVLDHIYYPAPSSPHPFFYHILSNFSIVWGLWLGVLAVVQLALKERARRVAHTLADCIFWVSAAYLLQKISIGTLTFGSFLALLVVAAGLSLIIRALALLIMEKIRA